MSLYDALKEVDKEIESMGGDGAATPEKDDKPVAPTEKTEKEAAPAKDEQPEKQEKKDPPAAPEKKADEEKPDAAAFAKQRRELAEEKRNREAAENRARAAEERLKAPPATADKLGEPAKVADQEPDKNTDPDAHVRWELRQAKAQLQDLGQWRADQEKKTRYEENLKTARDEFSTFEHQFQSRDDAKDYADVANFAVAAIAQSLRIMNPGWTQQQVAQQSELQLLKRAGAYQNAGHANPIEALYHEVKNSWGYQPKAAAAPAGDPADGGDEPARGDDGKFERRAAKPSLKQIAENKSKSASSMTPGGKSGSAPLTRDGLMKGGLSEWARLTPEQLKQAEQLEG